MGSSPQYPLVSAFFEVEDYTTFKQQLLDWASRFGNCCFLDNHQYESPWQQQECLVAAGAVDLCRAPAGGSAGYTALEQLRSFMNEHPGQWIFGHLGYGLKNETERLSSKTKDFTEFDDLLFFIPRVVAQVSREGLWLHCSHDDPASIRDQIVNTIPAAKAPISNIATQPRQSREQYLQTIETLRQHIRRGDCYEINYCLEFFATRVQVSPLLLYQGLSGLSPNPFSCYYKSGASHLACASPERFIQKSGDHIISQPIKGTAPRQMGMPLADEQQRHALQQSAKDRSENVMVVDLVRNDLSRVCQRGTVRVEELFGIYSYPQVHQMISTIGGTLQPGIHLADIIKATFPMGSMTGAPKKRVMELIDTYEPTSRGLFSGSVGYIDPSGNFDFNVVIRSLLYNEANGYLSFFAGSGITWYSQPEQEYEECMIKAKAMMQVLGQVR